MEKPTMFEENATVALNAQQSTAILATAELKVNALIKFINNYYKCECSETFGVRLFEVLEDIAFCEEKSQWYNLRIIKEIDIYLNHYGFTSMQEWCQYAEHLPTPFLSKDEAEYFLKDHKRSIFKHLLLQAARKIHPAFFKIAKAEISSIMPNNLIDTLSIDKIYEISPLIDNIVANQAKEALSRHKVSTWEEYEDKHAVET